MYNERSERFGGGEMSYVFWFSEGEMSGETAGEDVRGRVMQVEMFAYVKITLIMCCILTQTWNVYNSGIIMSPTVTVSRALASQQPASILLTASLGGSETVWGRPSAEGASQVEAPQAPSVVG